jgi:hypothetical protein
MEWLAQRLSGDRHVPAWIARPSAHTRRAPQQEGFAVRCVYDRGAVTDAQTAQRPSRWLTWLGLSQWRSPLAIERYALGSPGRVCSRRGLFGLSDIIPLFWKRLRAGSYASEIQVWSADLRAGAGLARLRFEPPSCFIFLFLLPGFFLIAFLRRRPRSVCHLFPPRLGDHSDV